MAHREMEEYLNFFGIPHLTNLPNPDWMTGSINGSLILINGMLKAFQIISVCIGLRLVMIILCIYEVDCIKRDVLRLVDMLFAGFIQSRERYLHSEGQQ